MGTVSKSFKRSNPPSVKTESDQKMNNLGDEEVDYAGNLNDYSALDYGTRSRISKSSEKGKLPNIDNEFDYDDKEYQKDYPEDAKDYNDMALEKDYTDYSTKQYGERDELQQQDDSIDDIKRRQTSFHATQPNSGNDKNDSYGLNATEVAEPKPEGPKMKRDILANKITLKQNSDILSLIENPPRKAIRKSYTDSVQINNTRLGGRNSGSKQARQEPKSPFELSDGTEASTEGSSGNVVYITLKTTTMDLQRRYNGRHYTFYRILSIIIDFDLSS
ncbi:hypothetical protein CEXT_638961 [Caerostris extrusa]|uniref:Uncharacterized protein n=1 Tax=Caerostris extrusa TaxID=172846 RepID=A0AAV4R512_CAEEX|nr:hypothetical protein CEXT_638961 [Caerostris extrusa]